MFNHSYDHTYLPFTVGLLPPYFAKGEQSCIETSKDRWRLLRFPNSHATILSVQWACKYFKLQSCLCSVRANISRYNFVCIVYVQRFQTMYNPVCANASNCTLHDRVVRIITLWPQWHIETEKKKKNNDIWCTLHLAWQKGGQQQERLIGIRPADNYPDERPVHLRRCHILFTDQFMKTWY